MLVIAASALFPAGAAANPVRLERAVFVEHGERQAGSGRIVEPAQSLSRGERVILVLDWRGAGNGRDFTLTSAVPRQLAFQRANGGEEVSVDGGRSWGRLGKLYIRDRDGNRLAAAEDVTHLRWHIPASEAQRASGTLTYSAIVR